MGPRIVGPISSTAGAWIVPDACTADGCLDTSTFFERSQDGFSLSRIAVLTRTLLHLQESLLQTNEIYGLGLFSIVAAIVAVGGQLGGNGIVLRIGDDAAAGALINASSRALVILALIVSLRGTVEQLSASWRLDYPGDVRCTNRPAYSQPKVIGGPAPFRRVIRRRQILGEPTKPIE